MKATAKDLRFHTKELLETANRGEEVVITFRGTPWAKLVPLDAQVKRKSKNKLFGVWKDHGLTESVDQYVRSLRKGRFQ